MTFQPDIRFTSPDEVPVTLVVEAKALLAVTEPSATAFAKSHSWITPSMAP